MFQTSDFLPEDNFSQLIDHALNSCSWLMALLTPSYFSSVWCRDEWEEASLRGKLLPVQVEPCSLHELWAALLAADLVGLNVHQAEVELLAAVDGRLPWSGRPARIASADKTHAMRQTSPWRDHAEYRNHPQLRPQIEDIGPESSHEARRIAQRRLERGDY